MSLPRIISVDDHLVEPPTLWVDRLPARHRAQAPHVVRTKAHLKWSVKDWEIVAGSDDPGAVWADMWVYEDSQVMIPKGTVASGYAREELDGVPVTYDEGMRPGCYDRDHRLADLDVNDTDASMCFPTISRFCGQFFMNRKDPGLALECLRVYNDWMIDEWCGGPGRGRLIPLTLIPMWDPELAAVEVRRCAAKGAHSVAFSEAPPALGLPSLYSGHWDPFIAACQDTDTVINMHIGSASTVARTAPDSPHIVSAALFFEYGMHAVIDWIMSGTLARFPEQRIAMSEAQVGWLPYVLERLDKAWQRHDPIDVLPDVVRLPSSYFAGRVFGCVFDDLHGLESRHLIGMDQIMFETDYPHADSTWPHSSATAEKLIAEAGLDEAEVTKLLRTNAIACYGLDRYFGIMS
jgi:predicted TIM-barrel fold metal-dependent hydrolase